MSKLPEIRGLDDFYIVVGLAGERERYGKRCLTDLPWEIVEHHFDGASQQYILGALKSLHRALRELGEFTDTEGVLELTNIVSDRVVTPE